MHWNKLPQLLDWKHKSNTDAMKIAAATAVDTNINSLLLILHDPVRVSAREEKE